MKLKQQMLLVVVMVVGLLVGMGLNGQAATTYQRSKITSFATRWYYSTNRTAKVYQISGAAKKTKLRANHSLKNYTQTNWKATKQMTLKRGKKSYHYYYVQNSKHGKVTGWVLSNSLKSAFGRALKTGNSNGMGQYKVDGMNLSAYSTRAFSTVKIGNYMMGPIKYQYMPSYKKLGSFQTNPETLGLLRRTRDKTSRYTLKTSMYLPIDYKSTPAHRFTSKSVLGNPQSATFSKDDHYLYVMYTDNTKANNDSQPGWVIRYDWNRLTSLGASKAGRMDMLRRATNRYWHGTTTAFDRQVLACIKVGPRFATGHAQSLALNPKTNELWFIKAYKNGYQATAERLNGTTLRPNAAVRFQLKSNVHMGSVLTFDAAGNAYFWAQMKTAWPRAGVNSVKIYQGKLSTSNVHFKLVMQGINKAPGQVLQSMSYNTSDHRLYLAADESIFSIPTNRLGKLRTSDVSASNFSGNREFEGLVFKHRSATGYVLTNKGPEMMQMMR
ncbi:hypothetical protein C5Z26_08355 [Lactobacillus sp. CBA3606]|uniref:hypothetical protein n=1 Tax=Lactobacillus sp. CBA3606 TaxID=2099789 RepID=UPI000CFD087B|nr:hypothetical protein [Lactobacillus sp. CBA3606]AVK64122.1 hypothetical protein C5Z26_08355 [Lactobacillus sp. CBA3606]